VPQAGTPPRRPSPPQPQPRGRTRRPRGRRGSARTQRTARWDAGCDGGCGRRRVGAPGPGQSSSRSAREVHTARPVHTKGRAWQPRETDRQSAAQDPRCRKAALSTISISLVIACTRGDRARRMRADLDAGGREPRRECLKGACAHAEWRESEKTRTCGARRKLRDRAHKAAVGGSHGGDGGAGCCGDGRGRGGSSGRSCSIQGKLQKTDGPKRVA